MNIKNSSKSSGFSGELDDSATALDFYSHDASMFEIRPKLVIKPKTTKDVEKAVKITSDFKQKNKDLSLTARSAATCMSGGAINDSVIIDFLEYFKEIGKITDIIPQRHSQVFFIEILTKPH
jgi:FAD/FMN-containing dehydrogenase